MELLTLLVVVAAMLALAVLLVNRGRGSENIEDKRARAIMSGAQSAATTQVFVGGALAVMLAAIATYRRAWEFAAIMAVLGLMGCTAAFLMWRQRR